MAYGPELARIHHEHFGALARGAARELLSRLAVAGFARGTVVDLAAGSGILSRAAVETGYSAFGVDLSESMLRIARAEAPGATFVQGSIWSVDVPPCVAVAAVGEAFNYAMDERASLALIERKLGEIHDALAPGGLLLFDVAAPGRSGPTGTRRTFASFGDTHLGFEEQEDVEACRATRTIRLFVREGERYRLEEEVHPLVLHPPEKIEDLLARCGFRWERLPAYADFAFAPAWNAYLASKPS